jgi:hypothetical protein
LNVAEYEKLLLPSALWLIVFVPLLRVLLVDDILPTVTVPLNTDEPFKLTDKSFAVLVEML